MRLIRGLHNLNNLGPQLLAQGCVATIGNFDGVHEGHRVILDQVKAKARELGLPAVVMVFEPQPREFFAGDAAPPRLMRFREKLVALRAEGVDCLVCLQFNRRLRHLTAEQFVRQVLVDGLRVRHLVVGDDFRFGCDRSGDFHLLEREGDAFGFTVEHTRTHTLSGDRVSSTRVREALTEGRLADAAHLLGHPFCMTGRVIHGEQIGRQIGAPTANIALGRRRSPIRGVFAVEVRVEDGALQPAVANVGTRPTVGGAKSLLEVHLLDFAGSLYGCHLEVIFRSKLRDEQRFASLDALKVQIQRDIEAARAFFAR